MKDPTEIDYFAVILPEFHILDDDLGKRNHAHCLFMQLFSYSGMGMKQQFRETEEKTQGHTASVL